MCISHIGVIVYVVHAVWYFRSAFVSSLWSNIVSTVLSMCYCELVLCYISKLFNFSKIKQWESGSRVLKKMLTGFPTTKAELAVVGASDNVLDQQLCFFSLLKCIFYNVLGQQPHYSHLLKRGCTPGV